MSILFLYHPVTLNETKSDDLIIILDALSDLGDDVGILITKSNADDEGRVLIKKFYCYTKIQNPMILIIFTTTVSFDCVVGNSSRSFK